MFWVIGITVLATSLILVLLQNFKTPEKVLERKVGHRYVVFDPAFRREMSVLLDPTIVRGNKVIARQNGNEIFPAMLQAIRSAQTSITFETFIYWSGKTGKMLSQALSERARTGVPVSVIIDWVGSNRMDHSLLDSMQAAGVRLHRYRPLHWYNFGRINNRTHRKLLVVDGRLGFTGGVGIADQWTGDAGDPEHWRDTHFRIEWPVVAQLQAAFNDNWIKTTGQVLNGPNYFPPLQKEGEVEAQVFVASPSSGSESMHLMYLLAIAAAEATIDLAASYFVPDRLLIEALTLPAVATFAFAFFCLGRTSMRLRSRSPPRPIGARCWTQVSRSTSISQPCCTPSCWSSMPSFFGGFYQLRHAFDSAQ